MHTPIKHGNWQRVCLVGFNTGYLILFPALVNAPQVKMIVRTRRSKQLFVVWIEFHV